VLTKCLEGLKGIYKGECILGKYFRWEVLQPRRQYYSNLHVVTFSRMVFMKWYLGNH